MKLPPPFSWLWSAWMGFSHVLGLVMSKIILTILWLTAFTIYALILKISGMFKKTEKPATYWVDAEPDFKDSMKYQF